MKYWQVSIFFLFLSLVTAGWACLELGFWDENLLFAAENAVEKSVSTSTPEEKAARNRDRDLMLKEKEIADRETILNDQLKRTDGVMSEMKKKLAAKDDEMKKRLGEQEAEFNRKLAQKESELKRVKRELASARDSRAQNYKSVYEKMDPKKAAKILDEMEISLSTQIIGDMNQSRAAEILAKMSPERARQITERPLRKAGRVSQVNEVTESTAGEQPESAVQNLEKGGQE